MKRREYTLKVRVNEKYIQKVIIDPHYEIKHSESINDSIILNLVASLDGKLFEAEDEKFPYEYYVTDQIEHKGNRYKLIWLLEKNQNFLGVINAYRR